MKWPLHRSTSLSVRVLTNIFLSSPTPFSLTLSFSLSLFLLHRWPLRFSHLNSFSGTMGEHVVLSVVDPLLIAPAILQPQNCGDARGTTLVEGVTHVNDAMEEKEKEEEDLTQMVECRICQEDDTLQNLDIPCACCGTLKFAHTKCVQLWCYEKGDTICEICHQPFKPGYTATSPVYHPGDTSIDISDDWTVSNPLDLHDSQLLAIATVEHQVPETEQEDYVYAGTGGTTLWHSVGLILMALLLLRHAAPLFNADVEKAFAYFYFFFLRAAAVIVPCYLMAWIIRIIQHQSKQLKNLHLCYKQRNNKVSSLQYHQDLFFTD
ncbi:hypothetical protein VNO78_02845 [Psophocarpus tetragonolobus]|uniref:RING-CH-type domain-containing protein n=1 Tax=Psophocarpus tetragonolobus TaxID=3891 RepID=A0AAN9T396_PSOTE